MTRLIALALAAGFALAGCPDDLVGGPGQPRVTGPQVPTGPSTQSQAPDDATTVDPEAALSLVEVLPAKGLCQGLEQVELHGTGFVAGQQVYFGESLAQDTFVLDSRRIVVLTPPRGPGLVDVRVLDVEAQTQAVLEAGFVYFNPVEVLAVDPPAGHLLGGEAVTVTGAGFRPESRVVFGHTAAVDVQVQGDGSILAVTPAGADIGAVDVHVSNDLGVGTLGDGFRYVDAPELQRVIPAVGPVAGGEVVEISGRGFYDPVTVLFGSEPLGDLEVVDATRVRGLAPSADVAGAVHVLVSTGYGTASVLNGYTYLEDTEPGDAVQILAVSPPSGPASGGSQVTIVAKGLTDKLDTEVTIGGEAAVVASVDAPGHAVVVTAPAGDEGAADVVVANSNGSDTLTGGFSYTSFLRVYEVLPNYGPVAGGTAVTISGEGLSPGVQVRVGALPASAVTFVDSETITAVTPPGSPGLTNVTVMRSGLTDTLYGGFAYRGALDLWVVDPPQGAQAGGTEIALVGSGFPDDARVYVGGRGATHVTVVSPTLITAKTPPGELGAVDVVVSSATRGQVTLSGAYTYYDPESTYGGTWGEQIEGDVNVTVLDSGTGGPIPDAFVILWTDPDTPYQGFTNSDGQITFSGGDLVGEQMVSASKQGYSASSVVEYDATNVTVYLNPTSPPSSGSPPAIEQPLYRGRVLNLGKSVPVPWGQCASLAGLSPPLCNTCAVDADCGVGYRCSDLPEQGRRCTQHCAGDANCPDGFMCYPLNGVQEHQCVPSAGRVTAYCDFSNGSIFAQDLLPDPGIEVAADLSFEIPVPMGEFAVYCWGGIADVFGQFTPYALGVDRHIFANPGDIIEGDIALSHPLNKTYTIALDEVPRGPLGPDINVLFRYLDLGSDGVITFLGQVDSWGSEPFTVDHFLGGLTGDLHDASFTFMGGSLSLTATFLPYTLTLHQHITRLEDDTMYYLEDGGWQVRETGVTQNINALWAAGPGDLVGVGTAGLIIRSLGTSWARQPSGVDVDLNGVHASAGGLAIAVGDDGAATHWDGFQWSPVATPGSSDLRAVWVAGEDSAFAVGFYAVMRWDGARWTEMTGNTSRNLNGVWGFGDDDVWAVGSFGQVIHWDGTEWQTVPAGTSQNLRAVWGAAADDVWMVGEGGTILRWDGVELTSMPVDSTRTLTALWGDGADNVYVVGSRGAVFHWDGRAWGRVSLGGASAHTQLLAIGGDAGAPVITGAHELILGPILAVPEQVSPADGGSMGADYEISWRNQPGTDPHFSYVDVAIPSLMGPVSEWTMINDWDVQDIVLPDMPNIEGTPGISPGGKVLTIYRVYKEGFDIDNYSLQDLNQFGWRSWAVHQSAFTKE
ncbi:MAG: hypothetical protein CSA66_03260 [Proteobacteria bacterium]|nr:MAG: hypothetical protein CSA66_03260 [Pseudomonadota bacterium]